MKYWSQLFLILAIGFLMFSIIQNKQQLDQRFLDLEAKIELVDHTHIEINLMMHEIKTLEAEIKEIRIANQEFTDKDLNLDWQLKTLEERVVEIQRKLSP